MTVPRQRNLLVVVADQVSRILEKGEFIEGYYNPGAVFDHVHLLLTNDDHPDRELLARTASPGQLHLHNLPLPSFVQSLGWHPLFLRDWVKRGLALANSINPLLVRAYGNYANGYLAAWIRKRLSVPFIVSLHTHPETDGRRSTPWWPSWKLRLAWELNRTFERFTLDAADRVVIVYEPQRDYAQRYGARDIRLIYNAVSKKLPLKTSYKLGSPPRVISVGRLIRGKNPENVIRAIAETGALLTIVGNGEYAGRLREVVRACRLDSRVQFIPAISNDQLCDMLPSFDLFATHCDYWGVPKAVIEPMLAGLPIVVNRRQPLPVPELEGDWVMAVENNPESYRRAIVGLLENDQEREMLGRRAASHARVHFSPEQNEQSLMDLYEELLPGVTRRC